MPAVRATMEQKIGKVYRGLDLTVECFPPDDEQDDPDAAIKVGITRGLGRLHPQKWVCYALYALKDVPSMFAFVYYNSTNHCLSKTVPDCSCGLQLAGLGPHVPRVTMPCSQIAGHLVCLEFASLYFSANSWDQLPHTQMN